MNRLLLTALFLMTLASPVMAQEAAPSDAQLQMPGSALPSPAPQVVMPDQPKVVTNTGANPGDPCPAPAVAASNTPDDLAKVQEEIDRFTLCVQRAQLLERLNESALKNQDTTDAALGYMPMPGAGMAPGIAGAQSGMNGLAPLPAGALAGADVTPLTQASAGGATSITPAATTESAPVEEKEPETPKVWTIREIFGSGDEVQARLLSPQGDEVKARNGMKLPDGKTTVVRITPAGVTVRDGAGAKSLDWAKS